MTTAADHGPAARPGRDRMRALMEIVGGVVLGLGLGSAVGLDPGLVFAAYAVGLGLMLLCLGLLLPEDPDDTRNAEPPHLPPLR